MSPTGMPGAGLSVVIVTDHFNTIRRVTDCLRAQTARDRVELVVVTPSARGLELDAGATAGLAAVRVVERPIDPMPPARAAGVRAASAPLVFLGETHSYPHPEFAATVMARHEGPWDVVVPGLENANPGSAMSWASFLADYGPWHCAVPEGEVGSGPTWNVVYRRDALLDLGPALDHALSAGDELWDAFRAKGRRWFHEPRAGLEHANVSRPGAWAHERFLAGRLIAANRNARFSFPRRVAYALASPLIALVVLSRVVRPLGPLRGRRLPRWTVALLVVGVILRTAGEAAGYLRGARARDVAHMEEYELHKLRYTHRDA